MPDFRTLRAATSNLLKYRKEKKESYTYLRGTVFQHELKFTRGAAPRVPSGGEKPNKQCLREDD